MDNPVGYLYVVGRNLGRRRPSSRPVFVDVPQTTGRLDIEPALPRVLASLSQRQRTAVVLVHCFQWTLGEVAGVMGVSKTTVQNHLERGMTSLRRQIGGVDEDSGKPAHRLGQLQTTCLGRSASTKSQLRPLAVEGRAGRYMVLTRSPVALALAAMVAVVLVIGGIALFLGGSNEPEPVDPPGTLGWVAFASYNLAGDNDIYLARKGERAAGSSAPIRMVWNRCVRPSRRMVLDSPTVKHKGQLMSVTAKAF